MNGRKLTDIKMDDDTQVLYNRSDITFDKEQAREVNDSDHRAPNATRINNIDFKATIGCTKEDTGENLDYYLDIPALSTSKFYDLFVCCSSDDADIVFLIINEIETAYRAKCLFANRDFAPGKLIIDNINEGINNSEKVVLMLSPDFTKSKLCMYELELAFENSIRTGLNCVIPVLLEECDVPSGLEWIKYIDATLPNMTVTDIARGIVMALNQPESVSLPPEITKMDSRSIEIYKRALEDGKEKDNNIRLMVVGHSGVGKTTLTKRLLYQDVDINQRDSTDGIDIHVKRCKVSKETQDWIVNHEDNSGSSSAERMVKVIASNTVLLANETLEKTDLLRPNQNEDGNNKMKIPLHANQIQFAEHIAINDQEQTETDSLSSTGAFASEQSIPDPLNDHRSTSFSEEKRLELVNEIQELNSAARNIKREQDLANISVWDFGGQFVFYSTHQMFLTNRAIYILIFKLSEHIGDLVKDDDVYFDCKGSHAYKIEDFIDIWLNSIHGHLKCDEEGVPPVILVGTHADKLNNEQRDEHIKDVFEAIRNRYKDSRIRFHLTEENFGLTNVDQDPKLEELRRTIIEVAKQQKWWGEEKPARWIRLEHVLNDLRNKGLEILERDALEDLNSNLAVPISSSEELDLFLRFHHEAGNIMYFSVPELKNKIVLDPKFLVDALSSIVTAKTFCTEIRKEGKLRPSLLDIIWTKEKNQKFSENRPLLLALMEHLNIIAKPRTYVEEDETGTTQEEYFLVPCMLKNRPDEIVVIPNKEQHDSTPGLCLCLESFVFPSSIFNRLLAACMLRWDVARSNMKYHMYCGFGQFEIDDDHRLTLIFSGNVIKLIITNYDGLQHPDYNLCRSTLKIIEETLKNQIKECVSCDINFEQKIACPCNNPYSVNCLHAVTTLQEKEKVTCVNGEYKTVLKSYDMLKYWIESKEANKGHDGMANDSTLDKTSLTDNDVKSNSEDPITPDHINHYRVRTMLETIGCNCLREILLSHVPAGYRNIYVALVAQRSTVIKIPKLNRSQIDLIYSDPKGRYTSAVDAFDTTLLYCLIRNYSTVPKPMTGWGPPPNDMPRDSSVGASVERLRCYRNNVVGHCVDPKLNDREYQEHCDAISEIIDDVELAIGDRGFQAAFEKIKNQKMDDKSSRKEMQAYISQVQDSICALAKGIIGAVNAEVRKFKENNTILVVPDAPEAPMVSEIFKDSALVAWQPPANDGGSPITGYHLEKVSDVGNKWVKVTKQPVTETTLKMDDLKEGTNYQYRVIAESKAGPGKPSAPTEPFAAKDPWVNPSQSGTPEIMGTDKSSVVLKWTPPTMDGGAPVSGYIIEYHRRGSFHWKRANSIPCEEMTFSVTGLKEGEEYEFRVSAENNAGVGPASEITKPVKVEASLVGVPPQILEPLSDTVIVAPKDAILKCEIVVGEPEAEIKWFKGNKEVKKSPKYEMSYKDDVAALVIHKTELDDSGVYSLQAENPLGRVKSEGDLAVHTHPRLNYDNRFKRAQNIKAGTTLKLPFDISGIPSPTITWLLDKGHVEKSPRITIDTTDEMTTLTVKNTILDDSGLYTIEAENAVGKAVADFEVNVQDKASQPSNLMVTEVMKDSMALSWQPPSSTGSSDISAYIIEKRDGKRNTWTPVDKVTGITLTYAVQKLLEGNQYYFRVSAENDIGISEPAELKEPVLAKCPYDIPDSPKQLQVTDITKSYMTMTWEVPQKDGGSPISSYVIERCQMPGSRWTKINKENVPDTVYTSADLVEGTEYKFRVAAENAAGVGHPSEPSGPIKAKDPYVHGKLGTLCDCVVGHLRLRTTAVIVAIVIVIIITILARFM